MREVFKGPAEETVRNTVGTIQFFWMLFRLTFLIGIVPAAGLFIYSGGNWQISLVPFGFALLIAAPIQEGYHASQARKTINTPTRPGSRTLGDRIEGE